MPNSQAETQAESQATGVRSLFDRIAPVYDEMNQTLSLGQHKIWKLMAVKWAQPKRGDMALDICCGSGDVAAMLADRVGQTGQRLCQRSETNPR